MTSPAPFASEPGRPYPRLARSRSGRVVAGVGSGVSLHLGVDVRWVRCFFAVSSFAGGLGLILYSLLWIFTPLDKSLLPKSGEPGWPRVTYVLLAALGLVGAVTFMSFVGGIGGVFIFILGIVAVGAVVAWQAYDREMSSASNVFALVLGIVLVMGGVLAIALLGENAGTANIVMAVLASIFGVSLLVVPVIVRLASSLVQERQAKAVADQRTEIASRLHDSVLQTLTLIQKRAGDAEEVARLARGQERELRSWLFSADTKADEQTHATVTGALHKAAAEVEDLFSVDIRPVSVGEDVPFSHDTEAIVLAAREAMVNAAKHADADTLDVYSENLANVLSVFVRDRGIGYDIGSIPDDRHGVRDSILGRMERAGGHATVKSQPGEGTEVELVLPLP